jgi:hypothetical protein
MRKGFRYALVGVAWLFLAAVVTQVYFAGLMLFGHNGGRDLHEGLGYSLGTFGVLFLGLPALARAGRRTIVLGVVLAVTTFFQPSLTLARDGAPLVAAFHPVNALLIFTLSAVIARRALLLVREDHSPGGRSDRREQRGDHVKT